MHTRTLTHKRTYVCSHAHVHTCPHALTHAHPPHISTSSHSTTCVGTDTLTGTCTHTCTPRHARTLSAARTGRLGVRQPQGLRRDPAQDPPQGQQSSRPGPGPHRASSSQTQGRKEVPQSPHRPVTHEKAQAWPPAAAPEAPPRMGTAPPWLVLAWGLGGLGVGTGNAGAASHSPLTGTRAPPTRPPASSTYPRKTCLPGGPTPPGGLWVTVLTILFTWRLALAHAGHQVTPRDPSWIMSPSLELGQGGGPWGTAAW